jgi:hypothetical protein
MAFTPWMTSNDLIEAVKRKIAFPVSQNTFSEEDILRFANEEMFISQVPSVLQFHEEYFVYRVQTPLVTNISRYPIPDRAIGMRLRDLMWSDSSGNYFEMTRINADDKAFFQRNIGANQAIHKFYVENNDVVLTPAVVGGPTGALNFFIFLRPNQLVKNDRARFIQSFTQDITAVSPYEYLFTSSDVNTVNNTISINSHQFTSVDVDTSGDIITILNHGYANGTPVALSGALPAPLSANAVYYVVQSTLNTFKLSETLNGQAIDLSTVGSGTMEIAVVHGYELNKKLYFYTSNALPGGLNDTDLFYAIPVSLTEFKISSSLDGGEVDLTSTGAGNQIVSSYVVSITTATQTVQPNVFSFVVKPRFTVIDTASVLSGMINSALVSGLIATSSGATIICTFDDITTSFVALNQTAFSISSQIGFNFDATTAGLMAINSKIDFMQTKPGHKTYVFDIRVRSVSGNNAKVNRSDLLVDLATGFGFQPLIANIQVGDYVCLAGESVIPQIPPDLHNMLAEKTAARILASLGDQAGLAMANEKIKEMEYRQGTLIDGRVDGSPQKITSRNSILRFNKMGVRKRM